MESGALHAESLYKELGEGNEGGISLSEMSFYALSLSLSC